MNLCTVLDYKVNVCSPLYLGFSVFQELILMCIGVSKKVLYVLTHDVQCHAVELMGMELAQGRVE